MDSQTGELYSSPKAAKEAGVPKGRIVQLFGSPEAVKNLSDAVKKQNNRRKNKVARKYNIVVIPADLASGPAFFEVQYTRTMISLYSNSLVYSIST